MALIGKQCYKVLVEDLDVLNGECLKYSLSKALGVGIVLGGSIVKVPQILKIVNAGSVRGLSLSSYLLETASYCISLAYNVRKEFPFSTYGETAFLTVQNILITLMILGYSRSFPQLLGVGMVIVIGSYCLASQGVVTPSVLNYLQAATIPLSLSSKIPQILETYRNKSTGQLSAFAVFNYFVGSLARVFTTVQETGDSLIFWGFALATVLNGVLVAQMIMYWDSSAEKIAEKGAPSRKPKRITRKRD